MNTPPFPVALLGYGGLIPFVGLAVLLLSGSRDIVSNPGAWLLAYGAVILSFVGALHWGFAMLAPKIDRARRTQCYVWSVVPALIGFLALILNSTLSYSLLIVGFALAYWQDADLANKISLPGWYPRLRAQLSIVASLCLLVGVF
ncbi:DUF3429 domain-containing protein [beta proteobacterium MWH-UniP1]